jgi:hypothetical protein
LSESGCMIHTFTGLWNMNLWITYRDLNIHCL